MFKNILIPLDGSNLAEQILPQVESLAKIHDSEITLLKVALSHTFPGTDPVEHQVAVLRKAENYLARIAAELQSKGLKVTTAVRYGSDAEEILAHASERHFELIAMSTHGRAGLGQFVLGSVASKIVHSANIPVLLYRSHT